MTSDERQPQSGAARLLPDAVPPKGPPPPLPDAVAGTWVASFLGFIHDRSQDSNGPPIQLAAFDRNGAKFDQSDGYFPTAGLICLRFDGAGELTGRLRSNRADKPTDSQVEGTYALDPDDPARGSFELIVGPLTQSYHFVRSSPDEMEWILSANSVTTTGVSFRAIVASGTMARIRL